MSEIVELGSFRWRVGNRGFVGDGWDLGIKEYGIEIWRLNRVYWFAPSITSKFGILLKTCEYITLRLFPLGRSFQSLKIPPYPWDWCEVILLGEV